ncbi:hypothetical protein [Lysinibacillus piscis]|uniref:hypothetical protein n=1 Tax=Lysinibacillus piscis TaxID=2518931 RepID=UPI002231A62A|nr:hypothetical protein [Lysinibacillus sp. KH24]
MNKKLFFTISAIPMALVAPTMVGAEENYTLTITGQQMVNGTLKANIDKIPANSIVSGYQWYYAEEVAGESDAKNTTNKPITGATKAELKVPSEAAGKRIFVEATTTTGNKYKSAPIAINALELTITAPKISGSADFAAPGETVRVQGALVTDKLGAKIQESEIIYSYQWFYKVGESFTIIDGATGGTYAIPGNALEKGMQEIIVRVKARVGSAVVESDFSPPITVSNESSNTIVAEIKALLVNSYTYNVSNFASFQAEVTALNSKYQALPAGAKANVTNAAVLKQAVEDIVVISKLDEKVNKLGEINAKDLPKYLKEVEDAYSKLNVLQRSLDKGDVLYTSIKNLLNPPTDIEEFKEVRRINEAILALLVYEKSFVKYQATTQIELQSALAAIDKDMAKLSAIAKAAVQNQTIMTDAKQDVKKVEQFMKLFDKLSANNTANKQVTTAQSIRTAYNKLTYKQWRLVPANYLTMLLQAESAEDAQISKLNSDVAGYVGNSSNAYPIEPSVHSWQSHVNNVNRIITEYKGLTKASAMQIVNYERLVTLQKDLKIADKVIKDIDAYKQLTETKGVAENKRQSAYTNVLKAYNKLTSLQQSLVYNASILGQAPNIIVDPNTKEPADKAAAEKLKADIDHLTNVTSYTFAQFEAAVNTATTAYKNLSSGARKYVTNYHLLTAASKDVSGVVAFHKKIQTAREELDVTKQAKKIDSVKTAYAKLPANQQYLAKQQYEDLLNNRLVDKNAPNLSQLNQEIAAILAGDMYIVPIAKITELSTQYNKLSAVDKKNISNAAILTTAVADVKKIESFMKQYEKSFVSNPATVIKAFTNLTAKQTSLLNPEIRQAVIEKDKGQQQSIEAAIRVMEGIEVLLIKGEYINNVEAKVKELRLAYDALTANDKKVVKNYSKLVQAETDLKKVADVHALYVPETEENKQARTKWQTTYSQLTKKLEMLYKNLYSHDL